MDGCQLTGACSSYARKYALNALLMIDDSKDSDDDSLSPRNPANQKAEETVSNPPIKTDSIEKVDKLPVDPVANFIRNEISDIQRISGVKDYFTARQQVMEMTQALVKSGAVEPFEWKSITMEQAKNVFKAVRAILPGDTK